MKVFRIFFKNKNALPTAKSSASAEVAYETIGQAMEWAQTEADNQGWRVVMVAELPTFNTSIKLKGVIKHSWGQNESDTSSQQH